MDKNRGKFAEPRGWALKWSFAEEAPSEWPFEREGAPVPTVGQTTGNGNGARKEFANPRGWALKWDGAALARAGEPRGGRTKAKA